MAKEGPAARDRYRLRVLPAGRNDRVVEINDVDGRVLGRVYSAHDLVTDVEELPEQRVRNDWESMSAREFRKKYLLGAGGGS